MALTGKIRSPRIPQAGVHKPGCNKGFPVCTPESVDISGKNRGCAIVAENRYRNKQQSKFIHRGNAPVLDAAKSPGI
jgi:hypothetical protein